MKKIFVSMAVFIVVFGMALSGALAATANTYASHDMTNGARTYKLANEAYNPTVPAAVADGKIMAVFTVTAGNPTQVEISMTGGTIDGATALSTYRLLYWDDVDADGVVDATECWGVVDATLDTTIVTGAIAGGKIRFANANGMAGDADGAGGVAADKPIPAGGKLLVVQNITGDSVAQFCAGSAQGTDMTTAAVANTSCLVGFNFSPAAGMTSGDNVSVGYFENASVTADATCNLATFMNEYVAGVSTPADAVIDVTQGRLMFTPASQVDTVVMKIADRDTQNTTVAPYNDLIDLSSGTYFLTTRAKDGGSVDAIVPRLYGTNQTALTGTGGSVADDGAALTYNAAGYWEATAAADVDVLLGGIVTITYTLTTDGTDAISTDAFSASLVSTPAAGFRAIDYIAVGTTAGAWAINGAQFIAPQMISRDGWETYLVFKTTTASAAATFEIDVFNRIGETATITGTIPAGSAGGSVTYSAGEILADPQCAGFTATGRDTDFKVTVTFTLPQTAVFVDGFKYGAGASFPTAVYDNKLYDATGTGSSQFIK